MRLCDYLVYAYHRRNATHNQIQDDSCNRLSRHLPLRSCAIKATSFNGTSAVHQAVHQEDSKAFPGLDQRSGGASLHRRRREKVMSLLSGDNDLPSRPSKRPKLTIDPRKRSKIRIPTPQVMLGLPNRVLLKRRPTLFVLLQDRIVSYTAQKSILLSSSASTNRSDPPSYPHSALLRGASLRYENFGLAQLLPVLSSHQGTSRASHTRQAFASARWFPQTP